MIRKPTVAERQEVLVDLQQVFDTRTSEILVRALEKTIVWGRNNGETKREDFRALRRTVSELVAAQRELTQAQVRTEQRMDRVEAVLERLAQAQARTEQRVEELAQAQARTEQRMDRVEAAIERLAQAQARTEQRMDRVEAAIERLAQAQARTEQRVEELAQAQARTEQRVEELAQAQTRTEQRMDRVEAAIERLAQAQARTEQRVDRVEAAIERLTQAQARTEAQVQDLAKGIQKLRQQVGGLSDNIGGDIEDIAYIVLYDVLKREFGWEVGELERSWHTWDHTEEEIDVFGQARDPAHPEQTIWIVGEAKHNLTLKEAKRFSKQAERARKHLEGEVFPVCFCYRARPEVRTFLQEAGLHLVFSYGKLL